MYLSELEIYGFKSFGQKTKFKFNGGITALVGPNGCGKTNIVDAIRWVLGEQKSSVLRSDVMENVIFNGTATRKPLGLSEVTMIIDNDKGILSSKYNQVNITRRLFRSGDSHYYLNKARCRLRDVQDLFMDTGMGADSYSVIELKMVEAILSGKPEERRHLFEEAAGITKYKLRRKDATNKLIKVREDLDRVNDILIEVQKNVNSLAKQASKTKRYNNLLSELKETELKLFFYEYLLIRENLIKLEDEISILKIEITKSDESLEKDNLDRELKKEELNVLQVQYQEYLNKERENINLLNNKKRELAVCEERLKSLNNQQTRIENEINNSYNEIENLKVSIEKTNQEILNKSNLLDELNLKLIDVKSFKDDLYSNLTNIKENYDVENSEIVNIKNNLNLNNNLLNSNKNKSNSINSRLKNNYDEFDILENSVIRFNEDEASIKIQINEVEIEIENLKNTLNTEKEKKDLLDTQINTINQQIYDNKNVLSSKKASLDFLKSLSDSDSTISYLMKSNEFITKNSKQTLIESIDIADEYKLALISALGESIHYFIVEDTEEADLAIKLLQNSKKGYTNFLIKNGYTTDLKNNSKEKNILTYGNKTYPLLVDFIKTEDTLYNVIDKLLGNVVFVENKEDAYNLVKSGFDLSKYSIITKDGTFFKNTNILKGGLSNTNESKLIGKSIKIKELESNISEINSQIEQNNLKLSDLRQELSFIDIKQIQNDLYSKENRLNKLKQDSAKIELNIHSIENNKENLVESNKKLEIELEELDIENETLNTKINDLSLLLDEKNEQFQLLKEELAAAETEFKNKESEFRDLEINTTKLISEIKSAERLANQLEEQLENFDTKLNHRKNDIIQNNEIIQNTQLEIETININLERLISDVDLTKNQKDLSESELKSKRAEIETLEIDLEQNRKANDKRKDTIHKLDLNFNEYKSKKNNLDDKLKETYDTDIDTLDYEIEVEYNIDENRINVSEIKRKLSEIGSVNFLALEEFEEQNQRLNFTQNQVNDLLEAEKILRDTIFEINQTAEKNFHETFDKVKENFKYLFGKLFNEEGFADIKLADGNPLESDIEITAKPPGKKPHSIEMLSGGEKTLTAIALLFAIYMVKPSPFCILDEVDAPLDDANIGRFINMIRQFTDNTQFLIVTHNKKTMEAADTLYGITQQEVGLSTIVSVRMGNEENGVQTLDTSGTQVNQTDTIVDSDSVPNIETIE